MKIAAAIIPGVKYSFCKNDLQKKSDRQLNFYDATMEGILVHVKLSERTQTLIVNQQKDKKWLTETKFSILKPSDEAILNLTFDNSALNIIYGSEEYRHVFELPLQLSVISYMESLGFTEATEMLGLGTPDGQSALELSSLEFGILEARISKIEQYLSQIPSMRARAGITDGENGPSGELERDRLPTLSKGPS